MIWVLPSPTCTPIAPRASTAYPPPSLTCPRGGVSEDGSGPSENPAPCCSSRSVPRTIKPSGAVWKTLSCMVRSPTCTPCAPRASTVYFPACAPTSSARVISARAARINSRSRSAPALASSAVSGARHTSGASSCLVSTNSASGLPPSLLATKAFSRAYASFTADAATSAVPDAAPAANAVTISVIGSIIRPCPVLVSQYDEQPRQATLATTVTPRNAARCCL